MFHILKCEAFSFICWPISCFVALCTVLLSFKKSFGCGVKSNRDKEAYEVMKEEYRKLGGMKFAEGAVLTIFVLLVILWFTRAPGFIDGWATVLFNKEGEWVSWFLVFFFLFVCFRFFFFLHDFKGHLWWCSGFFLWWTKKMPKSHNEQVPLTQTVEKVNTCYDLVVSGSLTKMSKVHTCVYCKTTWGEVNYN